MWKFWGGVAFGAVFWHVLNNPIIGVRSAQLPRHDFEATKLIYNACGGLDVGLVAILLGLFIFHATARFGWRLWRRRSVAITPA